MDDELLLQPAVDGSPVVEGAPLPPEGASSMPALDLHEGSSSVAHLVRVVEETESQDERKHPARGGSSAVLLAAPGAITPMSMSSVAAQSRSDAISAVSGHAMQRSPPKLVPPQVRSVSDADVAGLVARLTSSEGGGLELKTRIWAGRTWPRCFAGAELVSWLLRDTLGGLVKVGCLRLCELRAAQPRVPSAADPPMRSRARARMRLPCFSHAVRVRCSACWAIAHARRPHSPRDATEAPLLQQPALVPLCPPRGRRIPPLLLLRGE